MTPSKSDPLNEEKGWKVVDSLASIGNEYAKASKNYPPMNSYHEGYSIILEELDELWDEIKKKPTARNEEKLKEEAMQVAAMALRFMVDLT